MRFPKLSLLTALTLAGAFTLTACDGVEERKAKYMSQAQESFEQEDYDKAKLGFKNVIQIDPKDIDARMGLAKVFVANQDWRAAAGHYKGVLDVQPDNSNASIELGKLYLLARASDLALEEADKVLSREPSNIDAMALKAGVLAQQSENIKALSILEKIHADHPEHVDASILYASLLGQGLEFEKAIKVAERTLKLESDNIDLRNILAGIHGRMNNHELAILELDKVIQLRPDTFAHKQRLVSYLLQIGQVEEAQDKLREYIASDAENIDARKALVDLHIKQNEIDSAITSLKSYISDYPKEYDFQLGLARTHLLKKEADNALAVLSSIIESDETGPAGADAKVQLAQIYVSQERMDQAKTALNEVVALHSDHRDALMMRGQIALQEGRSIDAINDFRTVLKNDPDDAVVMRALADTHMQNNEHRLAENYYKQLTNRFPADVSLRNALASVYAKTGKVGEAVKLREAIQLKVSDSSINNLELAKLYASKGDVSGLKSVASILMTVDETRASSHYFEGFAHQIEHAHDKAIISFDKSLELEPKGIEPLSAKVKSLLALNKETEAKSWLESVSKKGDNPIVLNLLGEVQLLLKEFGDARNSFDQAIDIKSDWVTPHRNKALSYKAEQDPDAAIVSLVKGIELVEQNAPLRLELAQMFEATGNIDGAIEQYEILNQVENAPQFAANNLAMLLITYKEDQASLDRASQVAESLRGSTNPLFMDTLGWVYYKRDQVDLALPLIKEAANKAPEIAQINYHLAMAYHKKADKASTVLYLEKALSSDDKFVGRKAAEALLQELKS